MARKESISDDNQAVSPVIGVILMVAITVILAAVIGTFVLGLGDSLQQTPQAQISIDAAGNTGNFDISHNGGDELESQDLSLSYDTTTTNFESIHSGTFAVGETVPVTTGLSGEITVQLIHEPSSSIIAESTIDVS